MAILIDPPMWPAHGTLWSHLVSDADYGELHAFASALGIPRRGFDLDHYDVPAASYAAAVALGARAVSAREVVFRLRDSGLRVRQADRAVVAPLRRRQYLTSEWRALGAAVGAAEAAVGAAEAAAGPAPRAARGDAPARAADAGPQDAPGAWEELGESLLARWNETHRRYHDERHLEDVLLSLDQLRLRGERLSPETLLAAWFHDAVYAGRGGWDERASARLASEELRALGLEDGLVSRVGALVVATDPGAAVRDPEAPLAHLLDADLAILAVARERYARYAAAVREEYAHVPDADFASGRAEILQRILARPAIYRTPAARDLWERRARANVAAEVERLLAR